MSQYKYVNEAVFVLIGVTELEITFDHQLSSLLSFLKNKSHLSTLTLIFLK